MATPYALATRSISSVADEDFEKARFCSRCGQPLVVSDASFCKACGAPITRFPLLRRDPGFNPIIAAALSIVPGVGHIYRGKIGKAFLWFFGVSFAWTVSPPLGLVLHIICAANAAFGDTLREDLVAR
jgi:hypothetical protein